MERFDLSYRVVDPSPRNDSDHLSLIGKLVPDIRPENMESAWPPDPSAGDLQQTQICRIVDKQTGQSATAEGLFYQLIVRLHKYSLGRANYSDSVHWQRGLVLDNAYNGRAFLEHKGNDVHITVRAPYSERLLTMLTEEVKFLVESFWEGLRCDLMVPCLNPEPCLGLFEVEKLIENKRRGHPEQPCSIYNEWQSIDQLLLNAPAARPFSTLQLLARDAVLGQVRGLRQLLLEHHVWDMNRFDQLEANHKEILSKIDISYYGLIQAFSDEAKEGPRLFSLVPVNRSRFNPRTWRTEKFRLTLWCEHSRLPLTLLYGEGIERGVYELEMTRDWVKKAAPFLKVITGTLSLVLPVASSAVRLAMDEKAYQAVEDELDFGENCIDAVFEGSTKVGEWLSKGDENLDLRDGEAIRAQGAALRGLQSLLKAKDPGFGGLVRVMNKRHEFLWVHPKFAREY